MKNVFFIHSPVSWGPHSSAGADATLVDRRGREEGEQMCRFRWYRDAAGKCATFVWSNPSVAHSHTHTHTHTHTRGGILALAGPRGWDVSLWPERKRRVLVFTEALCVQRHNHAHQCFMHRYSGATLCFTASIWSDWNTHQHYFIRSLTHWTGSRRLKMTQEQKSVQIIRYDWPNRQKNKSWKLKHLMQTTKRTNVFDAMLMFCLWNVIQKKAQLCKEQPFIWLFKGDGCGEEREGTNWKQRTAK